MTVTATHRRRGLLSRMMANELAASKERGEAAAILIAAEYPIYGRFGFGPATWATGWNVDIPRAALGRDPAPFGAGRIDLVDAAEVYSVGPVLHDTVRRRTPGAINRQQQWWRRFTGELPWPGERRKNTFHAVYRDASGHPTGLLGYTVDDTWRGKRPQVTLSVRQLLAATPQAERALWHYALSVDWVVALDSGLRPPDDVLPLLLGDPRAAQVTQHADFMWLRVLDVAKALQARTYAVAGSLVLQVRDDAGLAGGRYLLNASPDAGGSEVRPTTRSADLTLDVGELGTLYLGDESAVRLAALGRVEEGDPRAAARADMLFRTPRRPWCPDFF